MPKQDFGDLTQWPAIVQRWLWLVAGCTALSAIAAFAVSTWAQPVYKATATLLVQPVSGSSTNEFNALAAGERLALTYGQMLKGESVLREVLARLHIAETPQEMAEKITAEPVRDTQLISLTVADSSPDRAALLANTIAETFIAQIRLLQGARYSGTMVSVQERMGELSGKMEETLTRIEGVRARKTENEVELARLEKLLAERRSDYRTLQQNHEAVRLSMLKVTSSLTIVGPAEIGESLAQPPYTATVMLLIGQPQGTDSAAYSSALASERQALTYSKLLTGRDVLETTIKTVGLTETPEELSKRLKIELIPDTQLIQLTVQDDDPARATLIANAIAREFVDQMLALQLEAYTGYLASIQAQMDNLSRSIEAIESRIGTLNALKIKTEAEIARLESLLAGYRSDYQLLQGRYDELSITAAQAEKAVIVAERAYPPGSPVRVRTLYTLLATAVGLATGVGAAFLLERLTGKIRTPVDVSDVSALKLLGTIGQLNRQEDRLVVTTQPSSFVAEDFRALGATMRTHLRVVPGDAGLTSHIATGSAKSTVTGEATNPIRTLLVTSPGSQEGKSIVVANLGVALAGIGLRVILVDANLYHPRLHELFSLDQHPGLTDWITAGSTGNELKPSRIPGLEVLTSGDVSPSLRGVLGRPAMVDLLEEVRQKADIVLIDGPSVLPTADAMVLSPMVDGVLLVVRANKTTNQDMMEAVRILQGMGANLVGVVLNAVIGRRGNGCASYGSGKRPSARSAQLGWRELMAQRWSRNRERWIARDDT